MMKQSKRWDIAQSYEKEYWKGISNKIIADSSKQLDWYGWKASELEKRLNKTELDFKNDFSTVLEIGSGPIGIVSYLNWGQKYALDPLCDFYSENSKLVELRNSGVNYVSGTGEKIPFSDGYFSFVIIDNVLDHVQQPDSVLNEIYRVLSNKGILYIELNIHTKWGCFLHSMLSNMKIDKGHPHSYTSGKISYALKKHKFSILSEKIHDYYSARKLDREATSLKSKIKGYSGLSEFIYSAVCQKTKGNLHESQS
jgi:ubiquinone/menaquinone biosynthesis C-methylase UbiE